MYVEPNIDALKEHFEAHARLFGGSAWCGAVRNYPDGWSYAVLAYDEADAAFVTVTVFGGAGDRPSDPLEVAADLLDIPASILDGLGVLDGHWDARDPHHDNATKYVVHAPTTTPAGRDLRKLIRATARKATRSE